MLKKLVFIFACLSFFLLLSTNVLAGNPPDQSQSSYTAPSNSSPADGKNTAIITIHLADSSGNPVAGDSVILSSSNDSTAHISQQNGQTTDGNGNATFVMTTSTAGTDQITLADTTTVTTFTNWFTVTFYPATGGCLVAPSAPVLTSVTSNSNDKATLSWTDSEGPVIRYFISYGPSAGKHIYGAPNVGGQGTTSFTVGGLTLGKSYYFVVAASNNCGASSFSNEMSAIVGPATPAPTIAVAANPGVLAASAISGDANTPIDTPTPTPSVRNTKITFRNIAIISLITGFTIIGCIFAIRKILASKT